MESLKFMLHISSFYGFLDYFDHSPGTSTYLSFFSVVQRTRYLGLYNFQFVHLASGEPREGVNRKWERALRVKG